MGLQGGEKCRGCDNQVTRVREECGVYKDWLGGKGSDDRKGRMRGEVWHCTHGGRLYRRVRRAGGLER